MSRIEEIEAAILAADAGRCIAALRGASETERAKAAPRVIELAEWDPAAVLERDYHLHLARNAVAVLALHGTAPLPRIQRLRGAPAGHPLFPVLADRRPEWLGDWASWTLSRSSFPYFADVRRLIRAGLIAKPASEEYVLAVIVCLVPRGNIRERAAAEPDVFTEDVWRFFEVEGSQSASLASVDKFSGGWKDGLVELARDGGLDRARLLDASLAALERGFAPFRASWFSAFHEALRPTLDESASRADRYLSLLSSRAPATVSFAMKAVARLEKAGRVSQPDLRAGIGPAVAARQKGVVAEALRMLSRIAQGEPGFAEIAAPALTHGSPEVRKAALELVEQCGGIAPVPRSPAPREESRVPSRIEPVRDADELLELFSAILEKEEPPEELERVLDGVSRFRGIRPARAESLAMRAARLPGAVLSPLALAWIRGIEPAPAPRCVGLISFLLARVAEAARGLLTPESGRLVGTPSHTGGSLEPLILVERLRENPSPGPLDLIQALLRLGPENRGEALGEARGLGGETGAAVRWALGADETPPDGTGPVWTGASQARDPLAGEPVFRLRWKRVSPALEYANQLIDLEVSRPLRHAIEYPADLTALPGTQDPAMLRWCATVWPANREGFHAAGALALARNLDWRSPEWGNRVYLENLAASRDPWGPMAYELLALGLACKSNGEAAAATEALIDGLAAGRVNGRALGDACARLATHGRVTISRWTKRLGATARLHQRFARELFTVQDRILAAPAPIAPNEMSGFLELLNELRAQSGLELSREARIRLTRPAPGGRAAKLVKSLL